MQRELIGRMDTSKCTLRCGRTMTFPNFAPYTTALLESSVIQNIFMLYLYNTGGGEKTTQCEKKCQWS